MITEAADCLFDMPYQPPPEPADGPVASLAPRGPVKPVDRAAQQAAAVAETLALHLGSMDAAIEFMRAHAGCQINVPAAAAVEALYVELRAAKRLDHDPSAAVVEHLSRHFGVENRVMARVHQRHNGRGLAADRAARKASQGPLPCRALAGRFGARHARWAPRARLVL